MAEEEAADRAVAEVLESHPAHAPLIRRLASTNETFRSICEDYALARDVLTSLERSAGASRDASTVAEYRVLVADLEREIVHALVKAG